MSKSSKVWEYYAQNDPYWSVLTFEEYKRNNLNDEQLSKFFQSGENHINKVFHIIEEFHQDNFKPRLSLDYGCGVGRNLIPLSRLSNEVIGVDISTTMLKEAEVNSNNLEAKNVRLMQASEFLDDKSISYDFLHSFIVLQHIEKNEGLKIFRKLNEKLCIGGIAAVHITFYEKELDDLSYFQLLLHFLKLLKINISSFWYGHSMRKKPKMLMTPYPLNEIFRILIKYGATCIRSYPIVHGPHMGLFLFYKKEKVSSNEDPFFSF
jgi:2-polyprenyl-3-methyl-5-hydroxy-6-metoxy-1,4-benzoquinol methylase